MKSPAAEKRMDAPDVSVALRTRRWRWAFWAAFMLSQALKWWLAARLPLFGDEAFYWQESRHLALGYSDLPGMTAWLIRAGETVGGHGLLAVRWPFLLLGALLPLLVVYFTSTQVDRRYAWQAGLLALALPLLGTLGVLALPDVMLTFAALLALLALGQAARDDRWRDWLVLGVALALALMSHYRAAMVLLAGLVFCIASVRGRRLWRRPGLYVALCIGACGALPIVLYNLHHGWVGLDFQALQRNPWRFHADALVQPLEQALVCTPLFYGLLLWAAWHSTRRVRAGAPWDLIASATLTFILGYFAFGLFADDTHFRVHWPLPGYLPLLAVVPLLATRLWRVSRARCAARALVIAAMALLALGQGAALGYLWLAGSPARASLLAHVKAYPKAFVGWSRIAAVTQNLLARPEQRGAVLVADNFRLAAELDYELGGSRRVYSLDSPTNAKHGRAPQLAQWQLDETAMRRIHGGREALLVVEETGLRQSQRVAWLKSVCRSFRKLHPVTRLDFDDGAKRVAFYRARIRATPAVKAAGQCLVWQRAHAAQLVSNAAQPPAR